MIERGLDFAVRWNLYIVVNLQTKTYESIASLSNLKLTHLKYILICSSPRLIRNGRDKKKILD